ncbi:MAG: LacI family DNA-binding transcriptional regulator [Thermoanaerobaculia bacterium]
MTPREASGLRRERASGGRVTLRELAAHLELSPTTVSLVLNRSPRAESIPEQTQARIFAAAEELKYRPNHMARSLRRRRSQTVGVLVPEIDEPYAAAVMSGLENYLVREGYFYLVASHRAHQDRVDTCLELLESRSVEGMVLMATSLSHAPRLPTVVVSGHQTLPGVTNVVIDHERAARLALEHLRQLEHRRIALVKGQTGSADTEERWEAVVAAAREFGVEIHDELVFQLVDDPTGGLTRTEKSYADGYRFGSELARSGRRFTALFAFNDVSAIGATHAFLEAGLRVPQDVSVVGFDDIASAAFLNPGLTTVRQPLQQMGETASRLLLARLADGGSAAETVTLAPELIVRESTGPAADRLRR